MCTVHVLMYLYLLQFLSSVSYNFFSIGLLSPWLNLFLGILLFLCNCKWDCFCWFLFLIVHYWFIKVQPISEYLLCILLLYNCFDFIGCNRSVQIFWVFLIQLWKFICFCRLLLIKHWLLMCTEIAIFFSW